ncbi:DUF6285 domain-containing protein [Afipia broomeae]|uniref:DUF6285 domain-containing protein n=1 Tax=Afipia broomeae ATCC 49717 TaxID=883078 RepID=K8P1L5_9BRAD|nr:DUF6285 domain-containing protein [Afipia broomeae]EKS36487.1 hypothetical protein HMPREF9695_02905 [Afipia broomeae ATCC 49717]
MQDQPTPVELINAVAEFLRADVAPQLSGHAAFKLRVGLNALDLVARQLTLEASGDAAELERLSKLLGTSGSLEELNRLLSARIASGEFSFDTPGLTEHVWQTTMDKLAIDQPNYASYRRERDSEQG